MVIKIPVRLPDASNKSKIFPYVFLYQQSISYNEFIKRILGKRGGLFMLSCDILIKNARVLMPDMEVCGSALYHAVRFRD